MSHKKTDNWYTLIWCSQQCEYLVKCRLCTTGHCRPVRHNSCCLRLSYWLHWQCWCCTQLQWWTDARLWWHVQTLNTTNHLCMPQHALIYTSIVTTHKHPPNWCCYGSQNLVSGRFRTDSWKNPRTRTRFRIPEEGIINLYTPAAVEHSACPLVCGKCGDDAPLRRSFLASKTQPQANVPCARHTPHTRTHARTHVDVRRPTRAMQAAAHQRTTLHNAKTTCHREVQYLTACIKSCNSNCNFNYNLFNRTREFFIPYIDSYH